MLMISKIYVQSSSLNNAHCYLGLHQQNNLLEESDEGSIMHRDAS